MRTHKLNDNIPEMIERGSLTRRDSLRLLGGKLAAVMTGNELQEPITTPGQRTVGKLDLPIAGAVAGAITTSLIAKDAKEIPVALGAGAIIGFISGAAFNRYFGITD